MLKGEYSHNIDAKGRLIGCRIKRDPEAGRIRRIKRVRKVEDQTWEKILCNKK